MHRRARVTDFGNDGTGVGAATGLAGGRRLRSQPAGEQPPADLDIDAEHNDPATSAAHIIEHFGLTPARREDCYPDPPV
jgi:hypothetical protein